MNAAAPAAGRSLRLLLVLALVLALWLALRLPVLERDLARLQVEVPAAEARPLTLVAATASAPPPASLAVAEAEVAVAEAALALAQARLRLVQLRAGQVPMVPQMAPQMAPPVALRTVSASAPARPRYASPKATLPGAPKPITVATADPPPPDASPPPASAGAHDLATAAYARLAAGDRRSAAGLFDAALAIDPAPADAAQRPAWLAERRRLGRRWSGEAYTLLRDPGPAGPAASPVLGGGQSGGSLAWTYDPLARRPLALVARYNVASASGGIDPATGQAAFGVRWRPLPGVSVSAERLVATGALARNDWTFRLAGGATGRRGRIDWSGYGEAGVLGAGDGFAGGQFRAGVPLINSGKLSLVAGPGAWASVQSGGGFTLGRVDIGPSVVARGPVGPIMIEVAADWRFRVAGGAQPGSGPAVTISTGF